MRRRFNTEGACSPNYHYMVRLDDRLKKIKEEYIDYGKYFVINRGRQYGKTTTLRALRGYLKDEYIVASLDFQGLGTEEFANAPTFSRAFADVLVRAFERGSADDLNGMLGPLKEVAGGKGVSLKDLFVRLSRLCESSPRPIVLMIDEVDSAGNNQVFIEFLALLRQYYLNRDDTPIFHSAILAGVYSIKNLKLKLRPESEHQYNSPWNTRVSNEENECSHSFDECTREQIEPVRFASVAADFDINMDLSADQIASMLEEYESDKHTGMDVRAVAEVIYGYTSGYPVLVSSICKQLDEKLLGEEGFETVQAVWTEEGIGEAVKIMLKKNSTLFEHMAKQLDLYKDMRNMMEDIIYRGRRIPFSPEQKATNLGVMFGFLKEINGHVAIANRMFEMCLINLFMAEEASSDAFSKGDSDRILFINGNRLDMDLVMKKFVEYFTEIYGENDDKFIEAYGRKFFLLYLKPIINGVGNFYIEAQTRDARRTDVIVDFAGEQFIVELKIWHGEEYNERGEKQLADYLNYYHKDKGYLLSFNFNKNKVTGVKEIKVGDKVIVEAVV